MLANAEAEYFISEPLAVLTVLTAVTAIFFWFEHRTKWKLFAYFPPLLFIYAIPLALSNTRVLVHESPVYDWMGETMLPFLLVVMLLKVDLVSTVRVMGKGILEIEPGVIPIWAGK